MASKIITFIALFLAILFLVSSQSAAARELSDQTSYDDPDPNTSYTPVVRPPSCGYSCNSSKKKPNTKPNSKPHN